MSTSATSAKSRGDHSIVTAPSHRRTASQALLFILAAPVLIVGLRLVTLLFGVTAGANFADFWYTLSGPFVAPFAGLTGEAARYQTYTGSRLELASLLALLTLAALGYVGMMVATIINRRRKI